MTGRILGDVPIPQKGNLQLCDNWQGISLLDIVEKVFARIIQELVQAIAEHTLPESQCGFRKKREYVDKIFVAQQLNGQGCALQLASTVFNSYFSAMVA